MSKKDKLDELISAFQVLDGDIKLLTEKRDEIKGEIEREINARTRAREEVVFFPGEIEESELDAEITRLLGDVDRSYEKSEDGDWFVTVIFPPEQESVELQTDRYEVKRTVFTRGDDVDFDFLKELAPDVYDLVVVEKEVVEKSIKPRKMQALLKEDPELLSVFRRSTVRGKPQSRLTFKLKENE